MELEREKLIEDLYQRAVELDPRDRDQFLSETCADDLDLRREVEALLHHGDAAPSRFLAGAAVVAQGDTIATDAGVSTLDKMVGRKVGRYTILRVLASGGMGTVYEAQQEQPNRTVAIKLIRQGLRSSSGLRRFQYESEALGHLNHPGIAQIFESGVHREDGDAVPYFAMELILHGRSITNFAADHNLGTRERLKLFSQVCEAVHHGHQKGIIHRDLKPQNILVGLEERPKVIDFGVARTVDSDVALTTLRSDVGQLLGTVQYMSPEQCLADPRNLDTRSDVYALGVVLYELLCGTLPYDVGRLAIFEATRIVREQSPTPPSTVDRTLRGDLETIVLKAMEKDRDRRYQSAEELRCDIERYLNGEPISARPASASYQLKTFARRNKALVGGVAGIFVVSIIAAVISTDLYWKADATKAELEKETAIAVQERTAAQRAAAETQTALKTATQTLHFLQNMLASANPDEAGTHDTTIREAVDRTASQLETELTDEPSVRMALHETLGQTYLGLGVADEAERHLRVSLELRRLHDPESAAQIGATLSQLADAVRIGGRYDDAERVAREAVTLIQTLQPRDNERLGSTLSMLAAILDAQGKHSDAEPLHREALDILSRVLPESDAQVDGAMMNLAICLQRLDRFEEAEALFRRVLDQRRARYGEAHPRTVTAILNLAVFLERVAKLDEAEVLYRHAVEGGRIVLGGDHPKLAAALMGLGSVLCTTGRAAEAEPFLRESLVIRRKQLGEGHPDLAASLAGLAVALEDQGKYAEATLVHKDALRILLASVGEAHPHVAFCRFNVASALEKNGEYEEAESYAQAALEGVRAAFGDGNSEVAWGLNNYARLLIKKGEFEKAALNAGEALRISQQVYGEQHIETARSLQQLGTCFARQAKFEQAEACLRRAVEICRNTTAGSQTMLGISLFGLGSAIWREANPARYAEAESLLLESNAILEKALPRNHSLRRQALEELVLLYGPGGLDHPARRDACEQRLRELDD